MHLIKQENLVRWTVYSDKVLICSLELKDVTKIDNFLITVNRLKTLADQPIVENVIPKEANNDHSAQSAMAVEKLSHTLDLLTTKAKRDATQHPALENVPVVADNSETVERINNKFENTIDEEYPEANSQEESSRYTGNVAQCSNKENESSGHSSGSLEVCTYICMYFIYFSDFYLYQELICI